MNTRVLLLFGGESSEHDVSIASARNVKNAIDSAKFDVTLGYIDTAGKWWLVKEVSDDLPDNVSELFPALGQKAFKTDKETLEFDVILPILHGSNGEDGSVQGLAQLTHIPIVGCDMTASAAAMNKYITKQIAQAQNIPITPYVMLRRGDEIAYDHIVSELGEVIFVKPARAGSSVGVSKVSSENELAEAMRLASEIDEIVLIESAVKGRELEVAVLGNYPDIKVSVVGEIKPDREFYSYESKYDQSSTSQVIIPAEISDEVSEKIKAYALKIFNAIGGSGLSRIDFFLTDQEEVLFNEVNTIPGFTDISMYTKLWGHENIAYGDIIERLIELALQDTIKEKES